MSYDNWKLATPPEYDELGPKPEEEGEGPEERKLSELPTTCCMNVGGAGPFKSCNKPAATWYRHNDDICSYCEEHDYPCGEAIEVVD